LLSLCLFKSDRLLEHRRFRGVTGRRRISPAEIATIKTRRGNDMQLGLALHIGYLRMSGRILRTLGYAKAAIGDRAYF
jgi:hypothetical protein